MANYSREIKMAKIWTLRPGAEAEPRFVCEIDLEQFSQLFADKNWSYLGNMFPLFAREDPDVSPEQVILECDEDEKVSGNQFKKGKYWVDVSVDEAAEILRQGGLIISPSGGMQRE